MKAEIKNGNLVIHRPKRSQPTVGAIPAMAASHTNLAIKAGRSTKQRWPWLWLGLMLALLLLALASAIFLRQNNLNMAKLRDQLVAVDDTGDVNQVQQAARKLQNYVAHHMNTTTGRVALQTLYNRAAEQAMAQSKPPEISTDVYQQATNDCKPQLINYGYRAWASCVATKVGLNATTILATAEVSAPDPDLYYVDYAPARWSFDLAGVSLLLFCLDAAILVIGLIAWLCRKLVHYCKNRPPKSVYRG